jgi:hypothetical protein
MKTLRITATLLLALAAAACTGSSPTAGSFLELDHASNQVEGTGFMGGGTK